MQETYVANVALSDANSHFVFIHVTPRVGWVSSPEGILLAQMDEHVVLWVHAPKEISLRLVH